MYISIYISFTSWSITVYAFILSVLSDGLPADYEFCQYYHQGGNMLMLSDSVLCPSPLVVWKWLNELITQLKYFYWDYSSLMLRIKENSTSSVFLQSVDAAVVRSCCWYMCYLVCCRVWSEGAWGCIWLPSWFTNQTLEWKYLARVWLLREPPLRVEKHYCYSSTSLNCYICIWVLYVSPIWPMACRIAYYWDILVQILLVVVLAKKKKVFKIFCGNSDKYSLSCI